MLFQLLQAAGIDTIAAAQAASMPVVPHQEEIHLLDMAFKGGWLMLVLLALSIVAIYLFGKKWWMIHQAGQIDANFMRDIRDYIHEGKLKSAQSLCEKYDSPVARLVEKGISRIGRPLSDIQTAIENTGNLEIATMEKRLPVLATIAGGAPMIGFLGTVIGMVEAFWQMSNAGGNIDISLLSGGIYQAMITTVGGLAVGIVALFGYNYLVAKIDGVVNEIEAKSLTFMDIVSEGE